MNPILACDKNRLSRLWWIKKYDTHEGVEHIELRSRRKNCFHSFLHSLAETASQTLRGDGDDALRDSP